MIVKIGVSFSVREARELVEEIIKCLAFVGANGLGEIPMLERLENKLVNPLMPDKQPAPAQSTE